MSQNIQLPSNYSPEVLAGLEVAFKHVWAMLYAQVPPDSEDVMKLSIGLSWTLIALATGGVTDPKELRCKALENMVLPASDKGKQCSALNG